MWRPQTSNTTTDTHAAVSNPGLSAFENALLEFAVADFPGTGRRAPVAPLLLPPIRKNENSQQLVDKRHGSQQQQQYQHEHSPRYDQQYDQHYNQHNNNSNYYSNYTFPRQSARGEFKPNQPYLQRYQQLIQNPNFVAPSLHHHSDQRQIVYARTFPSPPSIMPTPPIYPAPTIQSSNTRAPISPPFLSNEPMNQNQGLLPSHQTHPKDKILHK
ncbi:hypothetical protein HK100_002821, partial [Physocladia obscura]